MVGNDVVDLTCRETDPFRPRERFDARVCAAPERAAIASSPDPARERWSHWAAKEAAYKLLRKRDASTIFSPVRFEVELEAPRPDGVRNGRVRHGAHVMALEIVTTGGAVHAVATWPDASAEPLAVGLERLDAGDEDAVTPATQSAAVRRLALSRLAEQLAVAPGRLSIVKRDRIPELLLDGAPCGADLSLSHHGSVVAFACRLPHAVQRRLAS